MSRFHPIAHRLDFKVPFSGFSDFPFSAVYRPGRQADDRDLHD